MGHYDDLRYDNKKDAEKVLTKVVCKNYKHMRLSLKEKEKKETISCYLCIYYDKDINICNRHHCDIYISEKLCSEFSPIPNDKTMKKQSNRNKELKNPFNTQVGGNHYKKEGVMDVTEWCMAHGLDIGEFNVIKYIFRHEKKNGIEDLRKAKHYLEMIAYVKYKENL